ncbi:MAG: AAA family ATPase [Fuerstiella sp.]
MSWRSPPPKHCDDPHNPSLSEKRDFHAPLTDPPYGRSRKSTPTLPPRTDVLKILIGMFDVPEKAMRAGQPVRRARQTLNRQSLPKLPAIQGWNFRMYEKRFGLHRKLFPSALTSSDFFLSQGFQDLSPAILHALQSDLGVAVLTGPAGVGKSVSLEAFRRALESSSQTVFVRGGTAGTSAELLHGLYRRLLKTQTAAATTETSSHVVRRWEVLERLQRVAEFWGPLVILLDDAHLLRPDVFAELRSLLEEEVNGQKLVRLLVAGPLALEDVLAQPAMTDFSQKIRAHVFLQPLRTAESVDYLKQHVRNAGGRIADIFEAAAVEKIVTAADGIPRCLNLLTDEALMVCEESDLNQVTADVVNTALRRLQHLPLAWNDSPVAAEEAESVAESDWHDSEDEPGDQKDSANKTASVVEIGGFCEQAPGVIEIGAASSGPAVSADDEQGYDEQGQTDVPVSRQADVSNQTAAEEEDAVLCSPEDGTETCTMFDGLEEAFLTGHVSSVPSGEEYTSTDETAGAVDEQTSGFERHLLLATSEEITPGEITSSNTNEPVMDEPSVDASGADEPRMDVSEVDVSEVNVSDVNVSDVDVSDVDASGVDVSSDNSTADFTVPAVASAEAIWQVDFGSFSRWEPAGEWPVSKDNVRPVALVTETEHESFFSLMPCDRVPVFDRYTWCELKRPVSAEPSRRPQLAASVPAKLSWPPDLSGVVPRQVIPVAELDEEYVELLTDMGVLPDSVRIEDGRTEDTILSIHGGDAAEDEPHESDDALVRIADPDPELTIDQIQQLLHTEIFDATRAESSDDGMPVLFTRSADDPQDQQETEQLLSEHDTTADGNVDRDVAQDVEQDVELEVERDAEDDHAAEHSITMNRTSASEPDYESAAGPGTAVMDVPDTASCGKLLHQPDRTAETARKETASTYVPRLMQEARTRVTDADPALDDLQTWDEATCCETESPTIPVADHVSGREHRAEGDDIAAQSSLSAKARFSDLFTRLRRMKNRSA